MTILEKIKFEEDWLSEVNLTKENIKIAFAGIRATALEQQPCEDCVSRNHMIDVIKGKIADVPRNANGTYQRDNGMFVNGLHRALELVLNAPSIAPSRPQGEWEIFRDCEGKTRVCICKICGHKTGKYQWTNPNFCENCGARMNGGDEE